MITVHAVSRDLVQGLLRSVRFANELSSEQNKEVRAHVLHYAIKTLELIEATPLDEKRASYLLDEQPKTLPVLKSATPEEFPRYANEHPDDYNERLKLLQHAVKVSDARSSSKLKRSERYNCIVRQRVLRFLRKNAGQQFYGTQLADVITGDNGTVLDQTKLLAAQGRISSKSLGHHNRVLYWLS